MKSPADFQSLRKRKNDEQAFPFPRVWCSIVRLAVGFGNAESGFGMHRSCIFMKSSEPIIVIESIRFSSTIIY